MSVHTINPPTPPPGLPHVVLEQDYDATTRVLPPTPVETEPPLPVESDPSLPKLEVNAAVADHFLPDERRAASAWQAKHPEIPGVKDGTRVFPDPAIAKSNREMKHTEHGLGPGPGDTPLECFMADYDEDMEPYLAFRDGMSVNRIAKTYGIANVRLLLELSNAGSESSTYTSSATTFSLRREPHWRSAAAMRVLVPSARLRRGQRSPNRPRKRAR
jgi:hypothetical protein